MCQTRHLLTSIRLRFRAHRGHVNIFFVDYWRRYTNLTFLTERPVNTCFANECMKDHVIYIWIVERDMKTSVIIAVIHTTQAVFTSPQFKYMIFHIIICILHLLIEGMGGSVAKWSTCQTHNPAVLGLSPVLTTTWICFSVAPSSNPRPCTLVNSQLVCLGPVGILNNVMFNLNYLFQLFTRPH